MDLDIALIVTISLVALAIPFFIGARREAARQEERRRRDRSRT